MLLSLSLILVTILVTIQIKEITSSGSANSQGLSIALLCRDGVILSASTFLSLSGVHAHADYEWIRVLGDDDRLVTNIDNHDHELLYEILKNDTTTNTTTTTTTTTTNDNNNTNNNNNDNKHKNTILIALQGDPVDCEELFTILQRVNLRHRASFGIGMSTKSLAYFGSKVIASNLRSRQMNVNCFIGGWDYTNTNANANDNDNSNSNNNNKGKPLLYYLDSVGALQEVRYGSQGKEMAMVLSLLDRKNMEIGIIIITITVTIITIITTS